VDAYGCQAASARPYRSADHFNVSRRSIRTKLMVTSHQSCGWRARRRKRSLPNGCLDLVRLHATQHAHSVWCLVDGSHVISLSHETGRLIMHKVVARPSLPAPPGSMSTAQPRRLRSAQHSIRRQRGRPGRVHQFTWSSTETALACAATRERRDVAPHQPVRIQVRGSVLAIERSGWRILWIHVNTDAPRLAVVEPRR